METLKRIPAMAWAALAAAAIGFFVSIKSATSRTVNGEIVACDYLDFGKLIFAALAVGLALTAIKTNRSAHPGRRAPEAVMWAILAVVVIAAVILVLLGIDVIDPVCPAGT